MTADVDRLYAGPPGDFTAGRNEVVRQLKADGETEEAARVAKLRKPTVSASLVNRLVHRHRGQVDDFLAAAEDLRRAQEEAVSGEGGEHFRAAAKAERQALEALVRRARSLDDRVAESTLDRVRETLAAAAADPQAREALERGRLERELKPGSVPAGAPPGTPAPARRDAKRKRELAAARREYEALREGLADAERKEAQAREDEEQAQENLDDARKELRAARDAARKLRSRVNTAKRRLDRKGG